MNIEILNWTPCEADQGGMKRTGRGKSTGAVTQICMGTAQKNSCVSIFISN
jgi:hypothetical protein